MNLYFLLLLVGFAAAGDDNCGKVKGVGPGYEKSHLDYAGKFKGGARKFLPIYKKEVAEEKEVVIKGGEWEKEPCPCREKRSADCGCVKGVGPGYEKSHLDYAGKFKGGARKFLPIYKKEVAEEKEVVIKGGEWEKEPCPCRAKRGADCGCVRGVGPGYEKSHLDYAGKFKGGARKFLPIYKKEVAEEKEVVIKGGEWEKEPCPCRAKRGADCGCVKGVGPGYEKSHLDYAGKFKGGARKFLPIYKKEVAEEKEVVIKGGEWEKEPCPCREKRGADCGCVRGVGPGYEKSHLDYAGKFKGGARKFLPIYKKEVAEEKEVVIKGGEWEKEPCPCRAKRGADCGCVRGVGPGYEKSHLDYAGKFKGGARKFLPIYKKEVAEEKEVVIKGGEWEKEPCQCREKRGADCGCVRGVGPGYEKSHLDYAGKFKGGARKFLPIYEKSVAEEKDVLIKGGPGAHDKEPCKCAH
ncbi:hypothetical protein TTRE_0000124301 [Trichuris trichiura]|uniref:Uncharacterized protein n=1 Tax=Trichuris trichiura TaxID=36087 RepID=A0A077Z2Q3_TRITR|nr:hypothetical protein TTRE_0000124301 [Trichuris trichiura]